MNWKGLGCIAFGTMVRATVTARAVVEPMQKSGGAAFRVSLKVLPIMNASF